MELEKKWYFDSWELKEDNVVNYWEDIWTYLYSRGLVECPTLEIQRRTVYIYVQYYHFCSDNDSVAYVDWLGVVQNTWLVYQVEFKEEKVASRWYKDCLVWKKLMRHLEFSIAEGTCLCCVWPFSQVLLSRIRTSFEDLVSPFK